MSRCTICGWYHHPDFTIAVDNDVYKCVGCYTGKAEVTVRDDNTEEEKKVTKEQATRQYLQYLRWLREQPNVKKVLNGE